MIAMSLRQHRMAILGVVALVALVTVPIWQSATGRPTPFDSPVRYFFYTPTVLGGVFAVFWAAPLLTREYENRTHLFAWGQDVSPVRWLAGKVIALAGVAAVLSAALGVFAHGAVGSPVNRSLAFNPFDPQAFDSSPALLAAYTLFGFGLGLLAGAVTRQTLPAMGLTLLLFVAVRGLVAGFVRPHYVTPVHEFQARNSSSVDVPTAPPDGLRISDGYADAAGNPMDVPAPCREVWFDFKDCLRDNGVAGHFADFQTADRVPTFQWIESGLYLGLAVILFVIAFGWVSRRRRV